MPHCTVTVEVKAGGGEVLEQFEWELKAGIYRGLEITNQSFQGSEMIGAGSLSLLLEAHVEIVGVH